MLGAVHGSTLFPDLLNGVPGNHHYSSRGSISVPDVWRLDPLCPCRGLRVRMKEVSISGALTPHLSGLVCSTSTYINPRKPRSSMSLPTHPFLWRFRFSYFLSLCFRFRGSSSRLSLLPLRSLLSRKTFSFLPSSFHFSL